MVTREFLEERRTGIGGSDAPVILGVSRWSSPLQLWAEKVRALENEIREGEGVENEEENELLLWGSLVEPLVIDQYSKRTKRKVVREELFFRHKHINWLIGHADGKQTDDIWTPDYGIVECKNVSRWIWHDWIEEAPLPVKVQAQHYLAAAELSHATAVALIGGNQLVWHDFERNQKFIDAMLEEEERFWARVVSDNPPPACAKDHKFLNTLIKEDPAIVVAMPGVGIDLHDKLVGVKNDIEQIEAQLAPLVEKKQELEARIKQEMGDASEATLPDGSGYTFKTTKRKGYTVKESEYRVLRFKKGK